MRKLEKNGMQRKDKQKVVIDTNLLISAAIVLESKPHTIIKAWLKDYFILFTSKEQLEEIKNVSKRKKLKTYSLFAQRITELGENLAFAAEIVEPLVHIPIHSRDPKDDFLLASAIGADADYLVTGDDDLLVLNGDPKLGKLKILSATEFLDLIK